MIPTLSAEKDDGKTFPTTRLFPMEDATSKKPETVEICRSPPGNQSCSKPLLS
jgi:hypothetical protein